VAERCAAGGQVVQCGRGVGTVAEPDPAAVGARHGDEGVGERLQLKRDLAVDAEALGDLLSKPASPAPSAAGYRLFLPAPNPEKIADLRTLVQATSGHRHDSHSPAQHPVRSVDPVQPTSDIDNQDNRGSVEITIDSQHPDRGRRVELRPPTGTATGRGETSGGSVDPQQRLSARAAAAGCRWKDR
jgi:hypothetical protein